MPYKTGKMKGELTTPEIRKLIKAHNILVSIKIPKGAKREDIMGILQKAGYSVNHEKQALVPYRYVSKGKGQKLKVISQKTIEKELPKPKTKLEKQKAKEEKEEKNIQKKKQERTERKSIVEKALKQQEKTISKKTKPKPKPKTSTISTQTEEPKKEDKNKIITVFKDIITAFKEILEEADPEDRNNKEIKSIKNVLDKINKGSMSFTKPQKELIKRAIVAYLDMDFVNDPELQTEVNIAKKLKAKYK